MKASDDEDENERLRQPTAETTVIYVEEVEMVEKGAAEQRSRRIKEAATGVSLPRAITQSHPSPPM